MKGEQKCTYIIMVIEKVKKAYSVGKVKALSAKVKLLKEIAFQNQDMYAVWNDVPEPSCEDETRSETLLN